LREGIESMLTGDITTAKTILRDYINATVGFTELTEATHIPSKSLLRMLGPRRQHEVFQKTCKAGALLFSRCGFTTMSTS
jgi:hypothetical protein